MDCPTHHLDIVVISKCPGTISTVEVFLHLVLSLLFFSWPCFIAESAFVIPMILCVHVIDDGAAGIEETRASITFMIGNRMI